MGACKSEVLESPTDSELKCEIESTFQILKGEIKNILGGIRDFLLPEYTVEEARRERYRWQFYYWK